MATNELAAILARRKAKDGSNESPVSTSSPPSVVPRNRFERVDHLPKSKPPSTQARHDTGPSSTEGSEEAVSQGKSHQNGSKIRQLQQNLAGMAINPFNPGPPPRRFGGGESIVTTGEEYARTLDRGIRMPGMGTAIPMPGLAKSGIRIPGAMQEMETDNDAGGLVAHATLSRPARPSRRAAPSSLQPSPTLDSNIDSAVDAPAESIKQAKVPPSVPAVAEELDPINSSPHVQSQSDRIAEDAQLFDSDSSSDADNSALFGTPSSAIEQLHVIPSVSEANASTDNGSIHAQKVEAPPNHSENTAHLFPTTTMSDESDSLNDSDDDSPSVLFGNTHEPEAHPLKSSPSHDKPASNPINPVFQSTIPHPIPQSLFVDDEDSSDDESVDEGGLFGIGFPIR